MRTSVAVMTAVLMVVAVNVSAADSNLLTNGDFEQGLTGWGAFWARSGDGVAELVDTETRQGTQAVRIRYDGSADWSFPQATALSVEPGEIYELTGWVRKQGDGTGSLSVMLYDQDRASLSWDFGGRPLGRTEHWRQVRTRFVIPPGGATIVPRLMGFGPSEIWLDDVTLVRTGTVPQLRERNLPESLTIESPLLRVTLTPATATLQVLDKRTQHEYTQHPGTTLVVLSAAARDDRIWLELLKPDEVLTVGVTIAIDGERPEFIVELAAEGELRSLLSYPLAFRTSPGQLLIVPVNAGISYPVDDPSLDPMDYHLFGGHGLCMSFWGFTDLSRGLMAIVETPDDARLEIPRHDGYLCLAPQWYPQRGQFGPVRRIRYVALDQGGYVAMCKRYRQYAQQIGRFKTLAQKREENPHVDRLVGAVNVWSFSEPAAAMCEELRHAGIERILWSRRSTPEEIRQMNAMGVLTSRYDIYQDVMNPENFPQLHHVHPDWTTEAWPHDIVIRPDGSWETGWSVRGKEGVWYDCGVLCDRLAVDYARRRVPAELETHPYRCRFIDTTTAAHWRECYHPDHPMTRSESRQFRMELLDYMSTTCGLVTGSETGHDAAVPYVHYFEGMLSLGPYRVEDSGRDMQRMWTEVPERVAKFQTGHYYRLPLWELVYHDCVVAQWYWGDYNNKLPALWDRRDLINALYGTPPMFMFTRRIWDEHRDRFIQSYQTATPVARATAYSEMTDHRWLTHDRAVQQTQFANGVTVTVNFGDQPYTLPGGEVLSPMAHRVVNLER